MTTSASDLRELSVMLEEEIASVERNTDIKGTELQNEIAQLARNHGLGTKEKILTLAEKAEGLYRVCNELAASVKERVEEERETSDDETASNRDPQS